MPSSVTPWQVLIHREAEKELTHLPQQVLSRVLGRIAALAQDPRPAGCVKLTGCSDLYRLRVGEWRIVYHIDDFARSVTILRMAARGEVYRSR